MGKSSMSKPSARHTLWRTSTCSPTGSGCCLVGCARASRGTPCARLTSPAISVGRRSSLRRCVPRGGSFSLLTVRFALTVCSPSRRWTGPLTCTTCWGSSTASCFGDTSPFAALQCVENGVCYDFRSPDACQWSLPRHEPSVPWRLGSPDNADVWAQLLVLTSS